MQRRLFTVSGLFLMLWATPLVALAQEEANQPVNSTPIGEDNEVLDQFKRVEARYIPRGEWSRVVRYYQKQLDRTDHGLFSEDGELYLPLSVYCHHRIARLPEAGIVAYRRRVDPEANRLYAEAKSTTRLEPLRKLLRFYFNSTIGDEALLFAGSLYMELGRFRQALKVMRQIHPKLGPGHLHYPNSQLDLNPIQARIAYCLARLGEKFELTDLFRSWDYAAYWGEQLGQTNREDLISLASSAKSRRKASQTNWPYVYGGANHTNQAPRAGQITGPMQWIFPDSQIKVRQLFQGRFSRTWKKPTIAQTVVVIKGERLYTIQDDKIQAVNLFDGRLVWEADTDNQVSIATRSGWSSTMPGGEAIKNWRMVADPVANSLSLVGKHLFSIQRTRPRFMSRGTNKWQGSNTLRVYDTTKEYPEGSLSQVPAFGGAQEKREVFKNTYWLSTPVAYEGNIYLTAEQEGSYKIFCLNASTLQLLWVSHAAGVTDTAAQWYQIQSRAAAGSLIAAGEGHLYWVSQNGAVVCLDATTGEKVWVNRYHRQGKDSKLSFTIKQADGPWELSPPILAAGRLIVAPKDAHQLLCYDANTGEVLWKNPQQQSRMLAGVTSSHVYTLGKRVVTINLLDGRLSAQSVDLGTVTGRPALTDSEMYIPTAKGLTVLQLDTMKLQDQLSSAELFGAGSSREETTPQMGNLILAAPGILVSGHSDGVVAFYSKGLQQRLLSEITAKLTKNPDDLGLITRRAEHYQEFDRPKRALTDYLRLYKAAVEKKDVGYKLTAQEGIVDLAKELNRVTRDSKYIALALKYAGKQQQASLKLLLARSHEQRKEYRKALKLYLELRAKYSGQSVEIEERRVVNLNVLLNEAIEQLQRRLHQVGRVDHSLRKAALAIGTPAHITQLLSRVPRSPDRALLGWIHAYWLEKQQKQETSAFSHYREILKRYPGTPAALGCLWRLVEYNKRNDFPGRSLGFLAQIRDHYARVPWPPTTLEQLQIRWAAPPKKPGNKDDKTPDKKPGNKDVKTPDKKPGNKDVKKPDKKPGNKDVKKPDKKPGNKDVKKPDKKPGNKDVNKPGDVSRQPKNGLDYFNRVRRSEGFKPHSMPPKRASWHWTRYPVSATNKPKLSGQSEDGQINYRASHVIDVFPADQMIFIWADSRVEARSLKNWDILWRTNRINSPISINTGSHRFSSVGNILREVPRTRVFRSLNRAVVVHGNRLQGVHLTHGTLRWEIKIAADQPYGYSTQKTQPRGITRPPLMLRVAVTLDRVYTLSPGGTVSAFRSQDRELLWQMKIDQMRSGRIYVTQGKVLVLAAVGRKEDKKYQLWRWDEISGKLESNKPLDQPLVHLTNKLGPNGILYLASERTLRGYDPIKGIVVWEVHRDPIQEVFALTGDKVLLATGSRFDVLAGDSGRRVMSGTLGSRRVVQAKVAGSNLYLLTVPSLSRRTPQVSPWIGAFDIKRKKLLWRTSQFANLYYPYYFDLQPMTNGGVVFSSYSVNSSYNRTQIFAEGKLQSSLPTSTKRVSTRSTTRPQLHRCFAYGGYLFIPVQNGLQTYRSTK